jgi:hypothetical protein
MYVDQSLKRRRESSLIVTGLEPAAGNPDTELFASLCLAEFAIKPDVVSAKRLGHSQTGKVQPLLVYLKQPDQAQQLINSAKRLRHSSEPAVRDRVFINQNLTKAEAAAAYQLRVQRRQAMLRRQQSKIGDNCFVNHKSLQDHGSSAITACFSQITRLRSIQRRTNPTSCVRTEIRSALAESSNSQSVPVGAMNVNLAEHNKGSALNPQADSFNPAVAAAADAD